MERQERKNAYSLILFLLFCSCFMIIVGVTYAFFSYSKEGSKENTITTGSLTFLYDEQEREGNGITLTNAFPMSDEDGKSQSGDNNVFDFQVLATTKGESISYEVIGEKDASSTLDENVVKIYLTTLVGGIENPVLNGVDQSVLTYAQLENTQVKDQAGKTLYQETIPLNQTGYQKNFRLRMWVSETAISTDGSWDYNDQFFTLRIHVVANGEEVVPPSPSPTPDPTPTPSPVQQEMFDIADMSDLVGINYSIWFDYMHEKNGGTIYNISQIQAGNGSYGPVSAFHYWAEPSLGYYESTDKEVIRKHMQLLADAGIDFIILDNTNPRSSWISDNWNDPNSILNQIMIAPTKALLDTIVEMRESGIKTPYVLNWMSTDDGWALTDLFQNLFYNDYDVEELKALGFDKEKYRNVFVHWRGIPFMLTTTDMSTTQNEKNDLNYRKMWGLQPSVSNGEWSYLQRDNRVNIGTNFNGNVEQMSVSVAMQQNRMSNTSTALGRRDGLTFYQQWYNAFQIRPKYITLTWWNEWGAERIDSSEPACTAYCFTDNFNQEYSRDIEPMKGGHGDTYYQWMKEYIRAYKAHESCPKLTS